jgi:tetratricopeptide (TPR) repeat protein
LFLQAKHECNKRTREGLEKCVEFLTGALAADPNYAASHSAMAEALVLMAVQGEAPPSEMMPKAKASAVRALQCDANLGEAHVLLGIIAAMYEWDMQGAEAEFLRALEIAPNSPQALNWFSIVCLTPSARFDEAIAHLSRAQDLDPLSLMVATSLGYTLSAAGRTQDGLTCLRQAIELEPGFPMTRWALGLIYQELGNIGGAITEFETACELSGKMAFALGSLGHACAVSGRTDRALQVLAILQQQRKHRYVPALDIGLVYAGLQQPSEALTWFDRAYNERCAWLSRIRVDPRLRTLRAEERFAHILRKIGAQPPSDLSG